MKAARVLQPLRVDERGLPAGLTFDVMGGTFQNFCVTSSVLEYQAYSLILMFD
jgi:hypothetical protein